jgi:hypothetical protein
MGENGTLAIGGVGSGSNGADNGGGVVSMD